jgi:serine/threonine protein phosphatase PrpC
MAHLSRSQTKKVQALRICSALPCAFFLTLNPQTRTAKIKITSSIEIRRSASARLVALADGQGGQAGGALAARIAIQTALNHLEAARDPFISDELRTAISLADEAVEAHPDAGFSTLIVLACDQKRIAGASVGDSMALHIGPRGEMELSDKQRRRPPLGSGGCLGTPFQYDVRDDEQTLLMSDGVFGYVAPETLAQTCHESSDFDVLPRLLGLQKRSANGDLFDDWSAILIRF